MFKSKVVSNDGNTAVTEIFCTLVVGQFPISALIRQYGVSSANPILR
jgi:hypothetical protein